MSSSPRSHSKSVADWAEDRAGLSRLFQFYLYQKVKPETYGLPSPARTPQFCGLSACRTLLLTHCLGPALQPASPASLSASTTFNDAVFHGQKLVEDTRRNESEEVLNEVGAAVRPLEAPLGRKEAKLLSQAAVDS
ncbi:hypothetical protein JCM10213_002912 [Rhodosporidiobolus nylandii]